MGVKKIKWSVGMYGEFEGLYYAFNTDADFISLNAEKLNISSMDNNSISRIRPFMLTMREVTVFKDGDLYLFDYMKYSTVLNGYYCIFKPISTNESIELSIEQTLNNLK